MLELQNLNIINNAELKNMNTQIELITAALKTKLVQYNNNFLLRGINNSFLARRAIPDFSINLRKDCIGKVTNTRFVSWGVLSAVRKVLSIAKTRNYLKNQSDVLLPQRLSETSQLCKFILFIP